MIESLLQILFGDATHVNTTTIYPLRFVQIKLSQAKTYQRVIVAFSLKLWTYMLKKVKPIL
jgi:hypothetical protein